MFDQSVLAALSAKKAFSLKDFLLANQANGCLLGEEAIRKRLRSLIQTGEVMRVGRNAYCIAEKNVGHYRHEYSELAERVAAIVHEEYPVLEFSIFELIQLNEFVNHQLAHNVLFLSVEEGIGEFVFETLKEHFPGKVMLNPTPELYHQYWYEDMIVIGKLVTEAPKGHEQPWHTRLEKMLVDLVTEQILMKSISENEIPAILEDAFSRYAVDESCLFRYAKRRTAEKRLRTLIREKTNISLRTE